MFFYIPVKHVPYIVLSDLAVHWLGGKKQKFFSCQYFLIFTLSHPYLFGKLTMLNNENISEKKVIALALIVDCIQHIKNY